MIDITTLKLSKTVPTTAVWSAGVLTVAQGAKKTLIKLAGNFTGSFTVGSDGASGIDIHYAAPANPHVARLAQAMAGFTPSNVASSLTAHLDSATTRAFSLFASPRA